jgi:hypothetical protein
MRPASKLAVVSPATAPTGGGPGIAWHKNALEIARELAGLPTLVTVVASLFTENREILVYSALGALLVAIGLRFLPGIAKGKISIVAPWLVTALLALTLVLVLYVLPRRAGKKGTSLEPWLKWQNSLDLSAAKCNKNPTPESCLRNELAEVLDNRPSNPRAAAGTKLFNAMIAGQVLLANQTVRAVLQKRLSVDERFIGADNSEPVQHTSAVAAMVPEYLVPNVLDSYSSVWVWKLDLGVRLKDRLPGDHKLMDVLLTVPPQSHDGQTFKTYWPLIEKDHLASDHTPALVRFAMLDPTNSNHDINKQPPPSGCLGKPDATRVFMNKLVFVKDETLGTAIKDSGYTVRPDDPTERLYIWVYVPTQAGEVTRATWDNVLTNFTTWITDNPCAAHP